MIHRRELLLTSLAAASYSRAAEQSTGSRPCLPCIKQVSTLGAPVLQSTRRNL